MSWKDILKHIPDEINMRNLREYIKKDTLEAKALKRMYEGWKADNFNKKSRYLMSIRLFIEGLDDFGTMGWEL